MNYYQHNINDYISDTAHLTLLEHGAYRMLLDWIYKDERPLPLETKVVFRRLSAKTKEEREAVQTVLEEMFTATDDGYIQRRALHEIQHFQSKGDRARENGKLGGRPKKTKVVISAKPKGTKAKANQEPTTNNQKPDIYSIESLGVDKQIAMDWLILRRHQKAPVTKTVLNHFQKQAGIAGRSLEEVLKLCIDKSWRGFEASWIKDARPTEPEDEDQDPWHGSLEGTERMAKKVKEPRKNRTLKNWRIAIQRKLESE